MSDAGRSPHDRWILSNSRETTIHIVIPRLVAFSREDLKSPLSNLGRDRASNYKFSYPRKHETKIPFRSGSPAGHLNYKPAQTGLRRLHKLFNLRLARGMIPLVNPSAVSLRTPQPRLRLYARCTSVSF